LSDLDEYRLRAQELQQAQAQGKPLRKTQVRRVCQDVLDLVAKLERTREQAVEGIHRMLLAEEHKAE